MKIFTDSASDLSQAYLEQNNVAFFSLRVELDGQDYLDIVEIKPVQIFDAIAQKKQPKTSQVAPDDFFRGFEEAAKNGEEAIYYAFTSALSGTYNTAMMIAEQVKEQYPDFKLHIVDTLCASLGQGLVVQYAVKLRDEGASYEEVFAKSVDYAKNMQHLFTVDDLEHLSRNGRVSKTSAVVGGLLNIKPILNVEEGKLVPLDKVRGRKRAFKTMMDLMAERGGEDFSNKTVGICHSNDPELLAEVKGIIEERFHPKAIYDTVIGAVIGSHVGLGTVGIFFTNKGFQE